MATDYYAVLGVTETATPEEVRKAFRHLAREWHPDQLGPNATGAQRALTEDKYKEISEAYDVLSDAEQRQRYDRRRGQGPNSSRASQPSGAASHQKPPPRPPPKPPPPPPTPPNKASPGTQPEPSGRKDAGGGFWLLLWRRWRLVAVLGVVPLLLVLVISNQQSGTAGNSPPFLVDGIQIGPFQVGRTLTEIEKTFGPPEAQHSLTVPDSANGEGGERRFISQQRSVSGEQVTLLFAPERYFAEPNSTHYTETPEAKLLGYCTDSPRFHLSGNIKIGQTIREVERRYGDQTVFEGEMSLPGWIVHLVDVASNGVMTRTGAETISRLSGGSWGEEEPIRTAPTLFTVPHC